MPELTLSPQSGTMNLASGRDKPGWRSGGKVYRQINQAEESIKNVFEIKKWVDYMYTH
jgi:hypothetical protein